MIKKILIYSPKSKIPNFFTDLINQLNIKCSTYKNFCQLDPQEFDIFFLHPSILNSTCLEESEIKLLEFHKLIKLCLRFEKHIISPGISFIHVAKYLCDTHDPDFKIDSIFLNNNYLDFDNNLIFLKNLKIMTTDSNLLDFSNMQLKSIYKNILSHKLYE